MLYILDAYNVLHKMRRFGPALDQNLRTGREALIAACVSLMQARGDVTSVILVFDGRSEFRDLPQQVPRGIRLVFSETGEDADERIPVILEELAKQSQKCVVSDDNSVRNHARAYGVKSISVAEFEILIQTGENKGKKKSAGADKSSLPSNLADEITREYKKKLGL
jgi:predicted RNA-binding protein with PIN domain